MMQMKFYRNVWFINQLIKLFENPTHKKIKYLTSLVSKKEMLMHELLCCVSLGWDERRFGRDH